MVVNDSVIRPFYEELAVQVLPRPAVTALARGDFAAPLAQMALNGIIVQRFVKKSRMHSSLKWINVRGYRFMPPGK